LAALLHVGDLIDSGDKNGAVIQEMQRTEWAEWQKDYGLDGAGGRLKFPVYEIHGNHDGPHGKGIVLDGIVDRNQRRKQLKGVSANGLHYSWDAGPVHFVHLGITVGQVKEVKRKRRYDPVESLDFLVADLAKNVGASGRPVVIAHHVDFARYCGEVPDDVVLKHEWDYADVAAFHAALKPYRVAGIFYGHTHVRGVYAWTGPKPAPVIAGKPLPAGIPTFNTDNAAHFSGPAQAFLYAEVHEREILVRELATTDGWKTSRWTPLAWRLPHGSG
jgi:cytolysin (calcineurin-like family phosphatase)